MPIVIGIFGLIPLLLGLVLEYLCCRIPKRRIWRALPPALSVLFVVIVGVLAVGSSVLDYYGTMLGAKRFGASNDASIGSTLGAAAGGFIGKGRGSVIGATLGTVGAEYRTHRSLQGAMRASAGSLVGTAVVSFIQFVVALIIFVITFVLLWGAA